MSGFNIEAKSQDERAKVNIELDASGVASIKMSLSLLSL